VQATAEDIARVCKSRDSASWHVLPGARTYRHHPATPAWSTPRIHGLPGVIEAIRVSKPYKLVSREVKPTIPCRAGVPVGTTLTFIAGPCSVETRAQILASARAVQAAGAHLLRGGAYKPRTSPYAFQGLAEEGLQLLAEAREATGLGVVTEAIDVETFDLVEKYADCVQIGARNMQNFSLLRRAGRSRLPVLLKRGMSSTLEEFLMAAEYILAGGNYQVILCERGVRTFADHTRNTLDLSIVPAVAAVEPPADPLGSQPRHRPPDDNVLPMPAPPVATGAAGLDGEVHPNPDQALSDGSKLSTQNLRACRRVPRHCGPAPVAQSPRRCSAR
jgi:3-deoxy-7-phosphoheptulonate synthase